MTAPATSPPTSAATQSLIRPTAARGVCPDLPREHGAEGEIEIRQLVELERSDASG
jgi:hypothetical protein